MTMQYHKFNEAQREQIIHDYSTGEALKAIGHRWGCTPAYVSKLVRRRGHKLRRNYYAIHEGVPAVRQ